MSISQSTPFEDLLKQLITDPLQMKDTTIKLSQNQISRFAEGYDSGLHPTPRWDRIAMLGNGGIASSANDLKKYMAAYLQPDKTPFSKALTRASHTAHAFSSGEKIGYAWMITPGGSIWHNGGTGGFKSMMKIYLSRGLGVLYLTNTDHEFKCFIEAVENIPCDPAPLHVTSDD